MKDSPDVQFRSEFDDLVEFRKALDDAIKSSHLCCPVPYDPESPHSIMSFALGLMLRRADQKGE